MSSPEIQYAPGAAPSFLLQIGNSPVIVTCCIVYWVPLSAPVLWKINRQYPVVCTLREVRCFKFARVTFVTSFLSNFKFLSFWVFGVMLSAFFWQSFFKLLFSGNKPPPKSNGEREPSPCLGSRWALEKVTGSLWPFASMVRTTWTFNAPGRKHKLGKCKRGGDWACSCGFQIDSWGKTDVGLINYNFFLSWFSSAY